MMEETRRTDGPTVYRSALEALEDPSDDETPGRELASAVLAETLERIDGAAEAVAEEHDETRARLDARAGEIQQQIADGLETVREAIEEARGDLDRDVARRLGEIDRSLEALRADLEAVKSTQAELLEEHVDPPGPAEEPRDRRG